MLLSLFIESYKGNVSILRCYKRVDSGTDGLPWAEAESRCKTEGADLASVTSAYENTSEAVTMIIRVI